MDLLRLARVCAARLTLSVGLVAGVVLAAGVGVAANDARLRHHCAGRGESTAPGFHSVVQQPGRFVGRSESAAQALAKAESYTSRVTCRDGRDIVSPLDLRQNRINFGVHHGRVVGYWLG